MQFLVNQIQAYFTYQGHKYFKILKSSYSAYLKILA